MPDPTPARILIVDDEAAQMKALCEALTDQGYRTAGFTSARAALAEAGARPFDLVLTDLMMPEMDGIALLREAFAADANLVGIVMTGEGTIATAVKAMQTGAFDYVLKPFKLSVVLPVLARALAMRQLRMKNAELEQRVRDRTAELEAANRDLESFSYSVSHDLRTPLRHIDGFSQMLLRKHGAQMPDDAQRLLREVTESAGRMAQLIDDLLEFARLGRRTLSLQRVDLSALVRETIAELAKDRADRSVEIVVGELPDCAGDRSLLKQVFVNLLSNAFKFTRRRARAVVEVGCRPDPGAQVYFVRDNGAGFDSKRAQKLFGVFQRMHPADQFEGTGIGLSIVHRIIERHGGRIWAEAEVDRGATFFFSLPAAPPSPPPPS